jgi:ketosteroid isomerase-like protein
MHTSVAADLSAEEVAKIEEGVRTAMSNHLHSEDAATALSHYVPDATAVSNGFLYPSFDALSADVEAFYETLAEVNCAAWDDMRIDVLGADVAGVTARFRWSSTDTTGSRTDLQGVWSVIWVHDNQRWRILTRHESLTTGTPDGT